MNTKTKMASQHSFAMVPNSDIPRSRYRLQQGRKTTFNGGSLVPIYCEEMLPGDHFKGNMAVFARLATPITAVLDNAELETFFFFVPNRIVWEHWEDFITGGNYTIPKIISAVGGFPALGIYDQFGVPCAGQTDATGITTISALPFRAYNKIYNEWFRDQNLTTALNENDDDGPDPVADYVIQARAKKHDYFTSCLPWPQKGTAVTLPIGTSAPVEPITPGTSAPAFKSNAGSTNYVLRGTVLDDHVFLGDTGANHSIDATGYLVWSGSGLQADLSAAAGATINAIRTAFQVQRMLERDARGGTRYVEQLLSHFGVRSPDFRLQRPEYIGGGRSMVTTSPVAQTSSTDATTPQGNIAGYTTISGNHHNFSYAATEHGYVIGLANVRTDLTYQQGLRRHWRRNTRLDYYFPVFAHLGEQAVLNSEIYSQGLAADNNVFGYQERWAEYRYTPNEICGYFRSTTPNNIDIWHYAEDFATLPALNNAFIRDPSHDTLQRSMAVGEDANGQQILWDSLFTVMATRPMPTYSVPGLIDHF